MIDWRPIETGPKDGTQVLLYWQYIYPGDLHLTSGYEVGEFVDGSWETTTEFVTETTVTHWAPLSPPDEPVQSMEDARAKILERLEALAKKENGNASETDLAEQDLLGKHRGAGGNAGGDGSSQR